MLFRSVMASALGVEAVALGAVRHALNGVEERLEDTLAGRAQR